MRFFSSKNADLSKRFVKKSLVGADVEMSPAPAVLQNSPATGLRQDLHPTLSN